MNFTLQSTAVCLSRRTRAFTMVEVALSLAIVAFAMVAIIGLLLQASVTGKGIVQQLGGSFDVPEAVSKAGNYFPDGV